MNSVCQTKVVNEKVLSKMSHELKTPMNAILGLSDLALDSNSLDEIKDYLRKLHKSGECLLCTINDTLNEFNGKETQDQEKNVCYHLDGIPEDVNIDNLDGKEILLCEDHPMNVYIAEKLLEKVGCSVTVAKNGLEGVETFDSSREEHFDAIIMDIRMPIMDGLEASKLIRRLERKDSKKIPIIAMTANSYDVDAKKTARAGMNAHLTKPIVPNLMYRTLAYEINGD